jgi:hypothetical protein
MTPAEELAQAADKLDALVADVTGGSWRADFITEIDPDGAFDLAHVLAPNDEPGDGYAGVAVVASILRPDAAYIAAMNPLIGKALARWLRFESELPRFNTHSLEVARLINGSES